MRYDEGLHWGSRVSNGEAGRILDIGRKIQTRDD